MRTNKWCVLLAVLLVASGLVTACQPKVVEKIVKETVVIAGTPQVVEKVVKETVVVKEVVQAPTAAPTAVPAGALKQVPRNRTWVAVGMGSEAFGGFIDVEMYNPFVATISRGGIHHIGGEPLFLYNMIGGDWYNWQATGYEYNADFTEVTIKIREGVTWSDGHPFGADDVAFTITTIKGKAKLLYGADMEKYVQDVQVVDPLTVKITFKAPSPRFIWDYFTYRGSLGMVMIAEHVWKDKDPETFSNYDPAKGWPLGTGPYKLVASTVEQKVWDLREDWWGAKTGFLPLPKIERIIVLPGMGEITQAQMLIANQAEVAFHLTPNNMKLVQKENPKIAGFCSRPPYGFVDWWPIYVGFNALEAPFDDAQIRWAMSYSINRDEIVNLVFGGYSATAALPMPSYAGLEKYMDAVADKLVQYNTLEYNPAKTDQIMTGKGYKKDKAGFWVDAAGKRISFEIVTFPNHPSLTPSIPVVVEQLRRGGFDATFLLPADYSNRIQLGEAKVYMSGMGGAMADPESTFDRFHIRHVMPTGERASIGFFRWKNEEYSGIIDAMKKLPLDDPGVMPLWEDAMDIWLPELPILPLIQTVIQVGMNNTYWTGWPSCDDPYVAGGYWLRDEMLLWSRLQPVE